MENDALRLLVVDDDPVLRKLLTTLGQQRGGDWVEASDGHEGLERVRDRMPDIVITDWLMPGMDGLAMVRAIRAGPGGDRPYIILVTSFEDDNKLVEAFASGVDDFIGKPLRKKVIDARLRAGERIVRLQKQNERHIANLRHYSDELARSNERLREQAVTDELTGLPNRRYAMERIGQEWSAAERRASPLSCMVIDLDGFKQINDCCGHERGDEVLRTVAAAIRECVRSQDVVCRIGGDEFLVICPDAALDSVIACGERLVERVRRLGIAAAGHPFGLSIGAAQRQCGVASLEALIGLADRGMYRAKQAGKNRVYASQLECRE